ncbi:MAG: hypothetical protein IJ137_11715 [Eubacterium sp.]|nr:hypothetical protein [Eubacterium sp.]
MKKRLLLLTFTLMLLVLTACGKNAAIKGTYVHNADDSFGEIIIVHDGSKVSVTVDGTEYQAKMANDNEILVEDKYTILETYQDADGNNGIDDVQKDSIKILNAKDWIDGEYEVDNEGAVDLILEKQ